MTRTHTRAAGVAEGEVVVANSSTTTGATARPAATAGGDAGMFGELPSSVHLQMQLVAQASAGPDEALPAVIALLAPGSTRKQAAIVSAITDNVPLREQWERTWNILRT